MYLFKDPVAGCEQTRSLALPQSRSLFRALPDCAGASFHARLSDVSTLFSLSIRAALSPFHPFTLSPFHPFTLSPFRSLALSPSRSFVLSPLCLLARPGRATPPNTIRTIIHTINFPEKTRANYFSHAIYNDFSLQNPHNKFYRPHNNVSPFARRSPSFSLCVSVPLWLVPLHRKTEAGFGADGGWSGRRGTVWFGMKILLGMAVMAAAALIGCGRNEPGTMGGEPGVPETVGTGAPAQAAKETSTTDRQQPALALEHDASGLDNAGTNAQSRPAATNAQTKAAPDAQRRNE
jgi:hypothetical protein